MKLLWLFVVLAVARAQLLPRDQWGCPVYDAQEPAEHMLPSFIIAGAEKCGTTSLYKYLQQHPQFLGVLSKHCDSRNHSRPAVLGDKEIRFFDHKLREKDPHEALQVYAEYFPRLPVRYHAQYVTADASPSYLYSTRTALTILHILPNATIIVLLRDPVDRAYSHYQHARRLNKNIERFEDIVHAEMEMLAGCRHGDDSTWAEFQACAGRKDRAHMWTMQMLRHGLYALQLRPFLVQFRTLVLRSEDLFAWPQETLERVRALMGLPPFDWDTSTKYNFVEHNLIERKHADEPRYEPMDPRTRAELTDFFRPHVHELHALLERHDVWFPGWDGY